MKNLVLIVLFIGSFSQGYAQTDSVGNPGLIARMEKGHEEGFTPRNFEELVGASTIIVKGTYGRLISHQKFYGYGNSEESFQEKYKLTDSQMANFGLPMSEYEIRITETLKGENLEEGVIYRVYESSPATGDLLVEKQSKTRLFFLTENPDKRTYSHLGARFILTSQNGEYSYQVPISPSQEIDKVLEFSPSMTEFVVDQIVRATISRTQR